jgi:DNA-directed RNA polymerase subunit RPC12/RpoP
LTAESDDKIRCPSCGGLDVRHSLPRGILDSIMGVFHKTPFRCRRCERRFYSEELLPEEGSEDQDAASASGKKAG